MLFFVGELNILKKIYHVKHIPTWCHNSPEPASNSNHDNDGIIHSFLTKNSDKNSSCETLGDS